MQARGVLRPIVALTTAATLASGFAGSESFPLSLDQQATEAAMAPLVPEGLNSMGAARGTKLNIAFIVASALDSTGQPARSGEFTDLGEVAATYTGPNATFKSTLVKATNGVLGYEAKSYGPYVLTLLAREVDCGQASGEVAIDGRVRNGILPYELTDVRDQVQQAAAKDGYDEQAFTDTIVLFDSSNCGVSASMGEGTIVVTHDNIYSVLHEIGHAKRLGHGNTLDCGDNQPENGIIIDDDHSCEPEKPYGDNFTVMGSAKYIQDKPFNGYEMAILGALQPQEIQEVRASGTFELLDLSAADSGVRLLKIPRKGPSISGASEFYWVELSEDSPGTDQHNCASFPGGRQCPNLPKGVPYLQSVKIYVAPEFNESEVPQNVPLDSWLMDLRDDPASSVSYPDDSGAVMTGALLRDEVSGVTIRLSRLERDRATIQVEMASSITTPLVAAG